MTRNDLLAALYLTPPFLALVYLACWLRFDEWPSIAWVMP